ncbi:MAG: hypothetical protein JWQ29_889, partial [Phenylobacterium sp.]|nr:hypothetical protein [Phenylobacterium sp.]
TPLLIRAVAATALGLHIGGASLALAAGPVALLARKGSRLHGAAGHVFFASMLTMSAIGAVVSPMLQDRVSGVMGLFTFYRTATAWVTVRRRPGAVGRFEVAALVIALAAAVAYAALARIGAASPRGMVDGQQPYQIAVVFGAIAALAVVLDLRMIRRGGLAGAPRIARHLWRMCLALFIAAGSFAGQPRAQPEAVRGSPLLFLPALAVLVLMVFWLIRIRSKGRIQPTAAGLLAT